ncbi:MAG TPA: hypothetical protein PKC21_01495 [Oligoflexia bacterium]|nr:hypothetical protein [Oligoflexia bacterium]HMR24005.1 hypothetical protein [Oligoflexia bacterium]
MKTITRISLILVFALSGSLFAKSGQTKVNFGNMQIKGQTKNADSVYMSDRGQLKQKSQLQPRLSYRKEVKKSALY